MPAEWWFEAKTEEEAIERGIEELGLTRDEVEVVEVTESDRGVLGLIGRGKKVRVLLRVKQDWKASWPKPEAPEPEAEEEELDEAADRQPIFEERETEGRMAVVAREENEDADLAAPRVERARTPAEPPRPEAIEAQARAVDFLSALLEKMGMSGEVAGSADGEGVHLEVRGENGGILIGRRGATLDAIQYLVNRAATRGKSDAVRVFVDAEGYRARRNQQIEDMALRLADRAKKTGKPATIKNLNARERRIVHQALQRDKAISTKSVGEGEERKLMIIPRRSGGRHHGD